MSDTVRGASAAAAPGEELTSVLRALDAHLARDWSAVPAAELHAEVVALEQAHRRLRATQARVLAAARASGTARQVGYINERQMLTGGLGLAPGEARGRLEDSSIADTARMHASAAGTISAGHLKIINATLAAPPPATNAWPCSPPTAAAPTPTATRTPDTAKPTTPAHPGPPAA